MLFRLRLGFLFQIQINLQHYRSNIFKPSQLHHNSVIVCCPGYAEFTLISIIKLFTSTGSHPQSPTDILSSERNFQHMLDSKSEALSAVITNSIISGNYRLARENMKQLYLQPTIDSHRAVILDKGSLTDLPRSIIRQQTTVPPTLRQLIRRIRLSSKKSSRSNCNLYEEDKENRERDHLLKH